MPEGPKQCFEGFVSPRNSLIQTYYRVSNGAILLATVCQKNTDNLVESSEQNYPDCLLKNLLSTFPLTKPSFILFEPFPIIINLGLTPILVFHCIHTLVAQVGMTRPKRERKKMQPFVAGPASRTAESVVGASDDTDDDSTSDSSSSGQKKKPKRSNGAVDYAEEVTTQSTTDTDNGESGSDGESSEEGDKSGDASNFDESQENEDRRPKRARKAVDKFVAGPASGSAANGKSKSKADKDEEKSSDYSDDEDDDDDEEESEDSDSDDDNVGNVYVPESETRRVTKEELLAAHELRLQSLSAHKEIIQPFVPEKVYNFLCSKAPTTTSSSNTVKEDETGDDYPLIEQPPSIVEACTLRHYQIKGISWLVNQYKKKISSILADEMGLGKTLQSIAFLAHLLHVEKERGPFLVIVPLSVMFNWIQEFRKWCPSILVQRVHGSHASEVERLKNIMLDATQTQVVVATYDTVKLGVLKPAFSKMLWNAIILDEGHRLKNDESKLAVACSALKCKFRLILTGTPVQNTLHESFCLLSFLAPDIFTDSSVFDEAFDLNSKDEVGVVTVDRAVLNKTHFLMRPFVLRRLKTEVEDKLPPKLETKISCPMTELQKLWIKRLLYKDKDALKKIEQESKASNKKMTADGDFRSLKSLLTQLRKAANHPYLFEGVERVSMDGTPTQEIITSSGKMVVLDQLLKKLHEKGHRVVIFSQWTKTLDIISDFLDWKGYNHTRLDGSTNRVMREVRLNQFNKAKSKLTVFCLSTRAGGEGVNLFTADTVILFDSDWNPQVDMQAMARVHRIGQTKTVHIYRLITAGSVEERIVQRAQKKLFLDGMVNRGSTSQGKAMDNLAATDEDDIEDDSLLGALKFGWNSVFGAGDSGRDNGLTDDDLEHIVDRTRGINGNTDSVTENAEERKAKSTRGTDNVEMSLKEFDENAPLANIREIDGEIVDSKEELSEIDKAHRKLGLSRHDIIEGSRNRTSRLVEVEVAGVGKVQVLNSNNYSMEDGEQSVFARGESKTQAAADERKRKREHALGAFVPTKGRQIAGRDYFHQDSCQACGDGGDLICCDICPMSYHLSCIGLKKTPTQKVWSCVHHKCAGCNRTTSECGLIFRCEMCVQSYCEDCLPSKALVVGISERISELGYRPSESCAYIQCSKKCQKQFNEKENESSESPTKSEEITSPGGTKKSSAVDITLADRNSIEALEACRTPDIEVRLRRLKDLKVDSKGRIKRLEHLHDFKTSFRGASPVSKTILRTILEAINKEFGLPFNPDPETPQKKEKPDSEEDKSGDADEEEKDDDKLAKEERVIEEREAAREIRADEAVFKWCGVPTDGIDSTDGIQEWGFNKFDSRIAAATVRSVRVLSQARKSNTIEIANLLYLVQFSYLQRKQKFGMKEPKFRSINEANMGSKAQLEEMITLFLCTMLPQNTFYQLSTVKGGDKNGSEEPHKDAKLQNFHNTCRLYESKMYKLEDLNSVFFTGLSILKDRDIRDNNEYTALKTDWTKVMGETLDVNKFINNFKPLRKLARAWQKSSQKGRNDLYRLSEGLRKILLTENLTDRILQGMYSFRDVHQRLKDVLDEGSDGDSDPDDDDYDPDDDKDEEVATLPIPIQNTGTVENPKYEPAASLTEVTAKSQVPNEINPDLDRIIWQLYAKSAILKMKNDNSKLSSEAQHRYVVESYAALNITQKITFKQLCDSQQKIQIAQRQQQQQQQQQQRGAHSNSNGLSSSQPAALVPRPLVPVQAYTQTDVNEAYEMYRNKNYPVLMSQNEGKLTLDECNQRLKKLWADTAFEVKDRFIKNLVASKRQGYQAQPAQVQQVARYVPDNFQPQLSKMPAELVNLKKQVCVHYFKAEGNLQNPHMQVPTLNRYMETYEGHEKDLLELIVISEDSMRKKYGNLRINEKKPEWWYIYKKLRGDFFRAASARSKAVIPNDPSKQTEAQSKSEEKPAEKVEKVEKVEEVEKVEDGKPVVSESEDGEKGGKGEKEKDSDKMDIASEEQTDSKTKDAKSAETETEKTETEKTEKEDATKEDTKTTPDNSNNNNPGTHKKAPMLEPCNCDGKYCSSHDWGDICPRMTTAILSNRFRGAYRCASCSKSAKKPPLTEEQDLQAFQNYVKKQNHIQDMRKEPQKEKSLWLQHWKLHDIETRYTYFEGFLEEHAKSEGKKISSLRPSFKKGLHNPVVRIWINSNGKVLVDKESAKKALAEKNASYPSAGAKLTAKPVAKTDKAENNSTKEESAKNVTSASQSADDSDSEELLPGDFCEICDGLHDEEKILICGDDNGKGCSKGYHTYCLSPKVTEIPEDDWYCQECVKAENAIPVHRLLPKSPVKSEEEKNETIKQEQEVPLKSSTSTSSPAPVAPVEDKRQSIPMGLPLTQGPTESPQSSKEDQSPKVAKSEKSANVAASTMRSSPKEVIPKPVFSGDCKACKGRHTKHTCGKAKPAK